MRRMRTTLLGVVFGLVLIGVPAGAAAQAAAGAAPTFSKEVAPILFANCTTCHRPGEIAPMSLLTYKEARPWARAIAAAVRAGTMPPWHADPAVGHFRNARRLSDADKDTLVRWVEAGAPEGHARDLPPAPRYADGWRIGTPDVVLEMQEDYPIPASGEIPYLYFEVPANFDEDRWIRAWEMRPGNPAVVHHVIVYLRVPSAATAATALVQALGGAARVQRPFSFAPGMEIPPGQTGGRPLPDGERKPPYANYRPRPSGVVGSIGGYVPGNSTREFPEGTAMRLPKGSSLVFQMHYTPIGKETSDRTRLGLTFAKAPPATPLSSIALVNGGLRIPAGAADHRVNAEMTLNREMVLYSLTPHTHVRGKKWHYEVEYPDGRRQTILSVPNYDFDWQHEYQFETPLTLPPGTRLHASAWYDNSPANPSNPDPTKDVQWGDQTWEEMMFTNLTFHLPPLTTPPGAKR